jgi:PAS domain S-box-containing protein
MNLVRTAVPVASAPARPPARTGGLGLSWRILGLALAALTPLLLLVAALVRDAATSATAHAEQTVRSRAVRAAADTSNAILRVRQALDFLASRPEIQRGDSAACQRIVDGIATLDPLWANVGVARVDGSVMCASQLPAHLKNLVVSERAWFREAMSRDGLVVAPPTVGVIAGRQVVVAAEAAKDASGQRNAIMVVSVDLQALSRGLGGGELPAGSTLTLLDADGRVLSRYPEPLRYIGADASALRDRLAASNARGVAVTEGLDGGVPRVYAMAVVPPLGWTALVGVPSAPLRGPVREALLDALLGLAASLVIGALLAVGLARRLSRPLEALAHTAQAVADGDMQARAPVPDSPGDEVRTVALQFNRMLDHQRQVEAGLRDLNRLYEALARSNRAVLRGGRFEDISAEVCRACVESNNALLVAVAQVDGDRTRLLTGAGPVAEAIGDRLDGWSWRLAAQATHPLSRALASGEPAVCNDALSELSADPLTAPDHRPRVGSVAAFPLKEAGQPWGALLFHNEQPDWFDPTRVVMLAAMAADLSHVLTQAALERVRQAAEKALVERDNHLAGIVETAMDAVITIDAEQRIRVFNAAAVRIFRIEAQAAIGQPLERFIPEVSREAHARHVAAFARDGAASAHRMGSWRGLVGLRADGSEFPIEASIARHGSGSTVLMTAFLRDVSDRRVAEDARRAQMAAEAANEAKTMFLANMSHEIRTPMNAILGFTHLLRRTALTPQQARHLDNTRIAAENLLGLIDQILDLTKIEAGKLQLEEREFALDELLRSVQTIVGERAAAKGLRLAVSAAPSLPARLVGDAQRLSQVLINLGGNAVKFTERGSVSIQLGGEPGGPGQWLLQVRVADTGIGMSADELQRLFRPFVQADASTARRYGGTGLGLAISRQLIELMGGTIRATSEPGAGSVFSFAVRVGLPEAGAAPLTPVLAGTGLDGATPPAGTGDAAVQAAVQAALRGRHVLLVEDNEFNQVVACELLREVAGVQVTVAEDGPRALALLEGPQTFDAMLLDLQLPAMDGYEVARRVRVIPRHARLPILAMTAHASASDRAQCLAAGMNDFLTKPFDPVNLFHVLAEWITAGAPGVSTHA